MVRVTVLLVLALLACAEDGDRPFTTCPVVMPDDGTACRTQGLLCFYAGTRLIEECTECTDWPCSEQVSECNGRAFMHIDRSSCDGGM